MAFPVKLYIAVEITDEMNEKEINEIIDNISGILGYSPNEEDIKWIKSEGAVVWDYEDDGMNADIYLDEKEIQKLKEILLKINKKYGVEVNMEVWNLKEPTYRLEVE